MATLKIYSKDQTDALLADKADTSALPAASQLVPSVSGATQGDVLTVGVDGPEWAAGGGGGSGGISKHTYNSISDLRTDLLNHPEAIISVNIGGTFQYIANYRYVSSSQLNFEIVRIIPYDGKTNIRILTFHITISSSSITYYSTTWYSRVGGTDTATTGTISNTGTDTATSQTLNVSAITVFY